MKDNIRMLLFELGWWKYYAGALIGFILGVIWS